jgi:hypothetical protein
MVRRLHPTSVSGRMGALYHDRTPQLRRQSSAHPTAPERATVRNSPVVNRAGSLKHCTPSADETGQGPKTKLSSRPWFWRSCARHRTAAAVHVMVVSYDDYRVGATWEVASCNPGTSARNTVSARCVTSFVASSSILISHRPKEIIQWQ